MRAKVQRHPALAAEILRPIHGAEPIAEIVLSHHECPDSSGYPRGLKGDEIPLEASILRVADVRDAEAVMTGTRRVTASTAPAPDARALRGSTKGRAGP